MEKPLSLVNHTPDSSETTRHRRRFTAFEKLNILQKADACRERGEFSVLLRRNGIYPSMVAAWRRARRRGALAALTPHKRGPAPRGAAMRRRELRLKEQVRVLKQQLKALRAELRRARHLACGDPT